MIKNITRLEHKIGERVFHLMCEADSPISEVKDALFIFVSHVTQIEKAANEAMFKSSEPTADSTESVEESVK